MLYKYLLRTFFLFSFLFVELLTLNYNRLPHLLFLYRLWKVAILFHKDKKQLRIFQLNKVKNDDQFHLLIENALEKRFVNFSFPC